MCDCGGGTMARRTWSNVLFGQRDNQNEDRKNSSKIFFEYLLIYLELIF
jgi:hypothetical protein